jgi:hypothetical protein
MSNASRAMGIHDMPKSERPISEQFRLVAREWVEADKAANLLEETKTACLSQRMLALGEMPVSKAEMLVKASPEWHAHLTQIVEARGEANYLKVKLEFIRMKFSEWQSADANARKERGLSR